jgi:hypothetical protein
MDGPFKFNEGGIIFMSKSETEYQADLKKKLETLFPGIIILKNDPSYFRGVPDLTLLYKNKWAVLEVKDAWNAPHRPGQDYYIDMMSHMSFAQFIFPENEEHVLESLKLYFGG